MSGCGENSETAVSLEAKTIKKANNNNNNNNDNSSIDSSTLKEEQQKQEKEEVEDHKEENQEEEKEVKLIIPPFTHEKNDFKKEEKKKDTKEDQESKSRESITLRHLVLVVVVSLTSMTQGTASKGWTALLPKMQDNTDSSFTLTDMDVAWLVSTASIIGIFAAMATGPLVEWAGPCKVLRVSITISTALWFVLAFPSHKLVLYIARISLAASIYVISTISIPLLAELSPNRIRGTMSTLSELSSTVGVLIGYLFAHLFSWHLATALCGLTAGLLVLPMLYVPESPYWLVRRGRTEAALSSLQRLTGSNTMAQEQLKAITSTPSATQTSRMQQLSELAYGRNARPVVLVLSLFLLRELGGRSCIMMYTVYIFRAARVELDPFLCTVFIGVVRCLCTCVTAYLLDRTGRRPLLMVTAVLASLAQASAGLFLYLELPGASWVPLASLMVYMAAYGTGIGPVPWVYVGELLPSPVRSVAAAIIAAIDALVTFLLSFVFLRVMNLAGLSITFMAFASFNLLIGAVVCLWIPETKGVTLQQLELAFSKKKLDNECLTKV